MRVGVALERGRRELPQPARDTRRGADAERLGCLGGRGGRRRCGLLRCARVDSHKETRGSTVRAQASAYPFTDARSMPSAHLFSCNLQFLVGPTTSPDLGGDGSVHLEALEANASKSTIGAFFLTCRRNFVMSSGGTCRRRFGRRWSVGVQCRIRRVRATPVKPRG